jgi:hypothetical protein
MSRVVYLALSVVGFVAITLAAATVDYSGAYAIQQKGGGKAQNSKSTLIRVTQTDANIEISRTEGDKKTVTNRLPLDGSEADYTSPNGVRGKGRAQLKGEDMLVEWLVVSSVADQPVRLHTKERWRLSSDRRTLTIKSEVDFPDFTPSVTAAAVPNNPWTETYQRTD